MAGFWRGHLHPHGFATRHIAHRHGPCFRHRMLSGLAERPISTRQQKSRNKQQEHGLTEEWGVPHTLNCSP